MEKWLNEQAEATQAMNETLNMFIAIMGNQEVARNITLPPPVSPQLVTTTLQVPQPSRVKTDRCPLTSTANDASMITDIADVILCYENHSEHTQLAVTHLGKQSLILGYNLL
jgi:hypothetical protein